MRSLFFSSWQRLAAALTTLTIALIASNSQAAALDGPLTLVVGYAPGGSTDRVARVIGEKLQAKLGVPVVVDNKTGAGGRIAAQQTKRTPANQNVLMLGNPAVMVVAPLVFKDVGYDPEKDFAPVSRVTDYQFAVAVGHEVPVRELSHMVAWLRANPEKANFGVPAAGSLPHFFGLMLGDVVKLTPQIVGYRGSAPLVNDLLGGQVPVAIDTVDSLYPQHAAGKIRILAMSGTQRASFAKDIPTFREAGFNIAATGWNAFFAPAAMPPAKVQLLGQAIRETMQDASVRRAFEAMNLTPVVSTPAETAQMLKAFRAQWEPVVKRTGFVP
ncbi:MAG TPA: Bug family tripartite tricarboxylate transporter substrate binding protein [Burkholderiaceae bacterium]|nr:Bug family tripartite tricarboxylate transporter substrate binding protein [Burkholderiaceae bacterium]